MLVIILGSTGFIGEQIELHLNSIGWGVYTINRKDQKPSTEDNYFKKRLSQLTASHGQAYVVNCIGSYSTDFKIARQINVGINSQIFDACADLHLPLINLDTAKTDNTVYSKTKDEMRERLKSTPSLDFLNLRLHYVFGQCMPRHTYLAHLFYALRYNTAKLIKTPAETRDFVFVKDVALAVEYAVRDFSSLSSVQDTFEIGSGTATTFKWVAQLLAEVSPSKGVKIIQDKLYPTRNIVMQDHKFAEITSWEIAGSLEEKFVDVFQSYMKK